MNMTEDAQTKTCCEAGSRGRDDVHEYDGETLKTSTDTRTTTDTRAACC
ncbi:MAG TPA: hypothetical protein VN624_11635 [Rhodanobacter sp.]|nr:hypothetical protein [Rhodanobacter sp.]